MERNLVLSILPFYVPIAKLLKIIKFKSRINCKVAKPSLYRNINTIWS